MSSPRTVLITGANRGIGLELVRQLLNLPKRPELIFATYRTRDTANELFDLAAKDKVVQPIQLDVTDYSSFPAVVAKVSSGVGDTGLHLLINNAGIMPAIMGKLSELTPEVLTKTYQVNAIAPVVFTRAFVPLVQKAAKSGNGPDFNWSKAAIVNITSLLGSFAFATEQTMVDYRMSKAALNMFTKCLSIELTPDKILTVAVNPGWVQTDMGGPKAILTKEHSVQSILKTLAELNAHSNGAFLRYNGEVLPN